MIDVEKIVDHLFSEAEVRGVSAGRRAASRADDAEPVSTYGQAIWRLVEHYERNAFALAMAGPFPFDIHLVADIFWVKPEKVVRDVLKAWGGV